VPQPNPRIQELKDFAHRYSSRTESEYRFPGYAQLPQVASARSDGRQPSSAALAPSGPSDHEKEHHRSLARRSERLFKLALDQYLRQDLGQEPDLALVAELSTAVVNRAEELCATFQDNLSHAHLIHAVKAIWFGRAEWCLRSRAEWVVAEWITSGITCGEIEAYLQQKLTTELEKVLLEVKVIREGQGLAYQAWFNRAHNSLVVEAFGALDRTGKLEARFDQLMDWLPGKPSAALTDSGKDKRVPVPEEPPRDHSALVRTGKLEARLDEAMNWLLGKLSAALTDGGKDKRVPVPEGPPWDRFGLWIRGANKNRDRDGKLAPIPSGLTAPQSSGDLRRQIETTFSKCAELRSQFVIECFNTGLLRTPQALTEVFLRKQNGGSLSRSDQSRLIVACVGLCLNHALFSLVRTLPLDSDAADVKGAFERHINCHLPGAQTQQEVAKFLGVSAATLSRRAGLSMNSALADAPKDALFLQIKILQSRPKWAAHEAQIRKLLGDFLD
jgi:hypothetical protein